MDPALKDIPTKELMQRLAQERVRRGLTQTEVARKMGTSQPYLAKLEAGLNEPRLTTFLRYAAIVAGGVLLARLLRELGKPGAPGPPTLRT